MKGLRVAVIVLILLISGVALGEIKTGVVEWKEPCIKNRECRHPMKCIPATREQGDCSIKTSNNLPRCRCLMPSRKAHNCNDLADCKKPLRCIGGQCISKGLDNRKCNERIFDGDCGDGFTCYNLTCVPFRKEGAGCRVFWNCEGDLACIGNKCAPKSSPGLPCESSIDCRSSICTLKKNKDGTEVKQCDSDIPSIMGSVVAFTFVIATTGTLQFCAWRPRRRRS